MTSGKNLVMVEGKPGREYDRIYLTHGPTDETEIYGKTAKGKPVLNEDGSEWKGTRPKGDSKSEVSELVKDAMNHLISRYPLKDADKATEVQVKEYPFRLLLEAADYGADLWMRNEIQADLAGSKPIDKAAGIKKLAKTLMAMNPKLTEEKAIKLATVMSEDIGDESVAA